MIYPNYTLSRKKVGGECKVAIVYEGEEIGVFGLEELDTQVLASAEEPDKEFVYRKATVFLIEERR